VSSDYSSKITTVATQTHGQYHVRSLLNHLHQQKRLAKKGTHRHRAHRYKVKKSYWRSRKTLFKYHQQIRTTTFPKTLSPESGGDLIRSPINLHLSRIYILVDSRRAIMHVVVFLLTLLEDLEDEIATDGWVVCVAEMLVRALLEGFDAFPDFFGVVGVAQFLEY
jgi:hypothetical protein